MEEKVRILVADDNINLCKTMSFILRRKGYAVTTAKDGPEAIERVGERPFDIIFMDIKMPLMNGAEACKAIKKVRPGAVVIMMTAYAVEDLVQEALEEGAYGVIYKPSDIEKMINLIEEAMEVKRGGLILVVDDDPGTRTTFRNILTRKNYKVGVAQTGEEAIAMTRQSTYDIIFIDMKLPTINGLETYLAIKEIQREAVVIIITGYHEEMGELVRQALNNSAYTCLYKPLDMEEVLRLVDEILTEKQKSA